MKILIFSKHFWPENFRINDIAEDLVKEGNEVSVITTYPHYPYKKLFKNFNDTYLKNKKIKIYRVPIIDFGKKYKIFIVLNYLSFIFTSFILTPFYLLFQKFDVIFVFGTSPLIQGLSAIHLKYLFRSKLITWVLDLWPDDLKSTGYISNNFILRINEYLSKILYFFSDKILIQSNAFKEPINKLFKNNKTIYFPNPVDRFIFEESNRLRIKNKFNLSPLKFNITYAGNIGNNQSIDTIIESINLISGEKSNIYFHFFGSGNKDKYLNEQLKDQINAKFYGLKELSEMKYAFEYSDAFLISLADFPNLNKTVPGRVHTFMAAGKPILASCNGEAAKIILESKGGLVSAAENANLLKINILNLWNMSKEERDLIGNNGKVFALNNYHPDSLMIKLQKIFKD